MTLHSKVAFVSGLSLCPPSSIHSSSFTSTGRVGRFQNKSSRSYNVQRNNVRRTTIKQTISETPATPKIDISSSEGGDGEEMDVLIIGSGISGSSLAFNIYDKYPSKKILLTESRNRVGGNVISKNENGYIWEEGPNTFQPSIEIMRIIKKLNLENDLVLANHKLPRFVYWNNKLYALPMSPNDILKFKLLSPWGFIRAGIGAMGLIIPSFNKNESVKQFITRHLGKEVFEKMIDPFVSGVYAGNPSNLCMSAAFKKIFTLQNLGGTQGIIEGAIIRLNQKRKEAIENALPGDDLLPKWKGGALGSFKNGLGTLPKTIAEKLGDDKVKLNWELITLNKLENEKYEAVYNIKDSDNNVIEQKKIISKSVCITTPSRATASILSNVVNDKEKINNLNNIEYPTVWSVTLAYPTSEFKMPLQGFGNLIPRTMGIRTLGTIWSSALFPGRCPDGMELLLSYIGGAQDNDIKPLDEKQVVDIVDKDIKKILLKENSTVQPVVVGARRWERAIPQYNIGYWDIMSDMNESLKDCDGLFIGGNYTNGVAFGDCINFGEQTAPKVISYIENKFSTLQNKKTE